MRYAEVSVNSPAAQRRAFSYSIPPHLDIRQGQAVWIPFGDRLLQGVVLELTDYPAVEETRDIIGVIEPEPVLSPEQVKLARWICGYYLCPLFDAVSLMLPPGYERKAITYVSAVISENNDLSGLNEDQVSLIRLLLGEGKSSLKSLEKSLGQRKAQRLVSQMVKKGLVLREYELEPLRGKPKYELRARLASGTPGAGDTISGLRKNTRTEKQAAILEFLSGQSAAVSIPELIQKAECTRSTIVSLVKKGLVVLDPTEIKREPLPAHPAELSHPLSLTLSQQTALEAIIEGIRRAKEGRTEIFLLHGVTGSGKTEVYLQALAKAIQLGRKGIVLVPEIALTPQIIERFASRFPGRVAVLHSRLSLGEQYDEWRKIKRGEADVVIGPRSAVFAPLPDLGLIILDEEHEWTYKQQDSPRYHTRDVAVRLAELKGAAVVLGSATPDIESYFHAKNGNYHLLELPERITPYENTPLPDVEIVDLRSELKSGNRSMFSRSLSGAVRKALAGEEQVILFLNRRGAATCIQCRDCGFVVRCRRCEVSLTYHLTGEMLVCHQCNYRTAPPEICPQCGSRRIRFLGAGTQKLEQEAREVFPEARILRWDSDTTGRRNAHVEMLEIFRRREADILIGTQMIAKGLDLPGVTVVGVISADTALNLPDFRSGERTFQLLSQVAGRAGRGWLGGRVVIQSYSPDHYAIQAAGRHDFFSLYEREILSRRELRYPPFSRLASMIYSHTNDDACRREAERMKGILISEIRSQGIAGLSIIGPAPAFMHRLRGRYRWQLIIRGSSLSEFLGDIPVPQGWAVDIDPVGL